VAVFVSGVGGVVGGGVWPGSEGGFDVQDKRSSIVPNSMGREIGRIEGVASCDGQMPFLALWKSEMGQDM